MTPGRVGAILPTDRETPHDSGQSQAMTRTCGLGGRLLSKHAECPEVLEVGERHPLWLGERQVGSASRFSHFLYVR